ARRQTGSRHMHLPAFELVAGGMTGVGASGTTQVGARSLSAPEESIALRPAHTHATRTRTTSTLEPDPAFGENGATIRASRAGILSVAEVKPCCVMRSSPPS